MKTSPSISVVTTAYNAAATISTCLRSVACQQTSLNHEDQLDVEHIIADGSSIDETVGVVRRSGYPVHLVSEPDRSLYEGMNKGIHRAAGDVIGILNADDFYFHNNTLCKVAQVMSDPAIDICHGNVVYVRSDDPMRIVRVWRGGQASSGRLRRGWMPPHPTFFVRRQCYARYGLYREDLGTAADYELIVRFLARERLRSVYVPSLWVAMRTGGASNATFAGRLRANGMDRKAWMINGLRPSPLFRLMKPARKLPQYARVRARDLSTEIALFLEDCGGVTAVSA